MYGYRVPLALEGVSGMETEIKYVGVCMLLARLMPQIHDELDRDCIQSALEDCAAQYPDRFEVVKTAGGYSLEKR